MARKYEFYVLVARYCSCHSNNKEQYLATIMTMKNNILPREHKIHIFEPTCNVLFIIWRLNIQQKQKARIVTSLNDTTLTKVAYGKYATWVPDEVAYGIYEWFSSQFPYSKNSYFNLSINFGSCQLQSEVEFNHLSITS